MLHSKVASIETGPGYGCRTRDRIAGAKISAQAKGLAVDFMAIAFADKRRVLIERQAGARRPISARCGRPLAAGSLTVLGPGSDSFHAANMHLDIEPHGASGAIVSASSHAYCAISLPKDQFSRLTSTKLTKTSSLRRLTPAASPSAIAL